jgi:hypothetical protein
MGIARREIEARRGLAEIFQQAKLFGIRGLRHVEFDLRSIRNGS